MKWLRWKLRRKGQAVSLAEAKAQAEQAAREIELSRRRAAAVRKHVNEPRFQAEAENGWAQIIRDSIMGHDGRGRHEPG